jgi:hypothetical protein
MWNRRKAAIGYATYLVGSRVARRALRRKGRDTGRMRRRVIVPVAGGAAAAVAALAVVAVRRRGANGAAPSTSD